MSFLVGVIKIIFLLGFLVFIHEGGHFLVAKFFKVNVREFSIGFGPKVVSKQGKETKYTLRWIPFGGYVDMVGETERSGEEGSFSETSVLKRIAIIAGGALVNIIFGILVFFILVAIKSNISYAFEVTIDFIASLGESVKLLLTGNVQADQMMGPIGISGIVTQTSGLYNFVYLLSLISVSLGITNLLPIPALDGGRIVLLLIEGIRKKPFKEETELAINGVGFTLLILFSIYVSYNDIINIF